MENESLSRCYLCGQYLLSTTKCICCTTWWGCFGENFTLGNVEHCPECHVRYRTTEGCPHMNCKRCNTNFIRGQQANCPCFFSVCGGYWKYLGMTLCLFCFCPCASYFLHSDTRTAGPSCWCVDM